MSLSGASVSPNVVGINFNNNSYFPSTLSNLVAGNFISISNAFGSTHLYEIASVVTSNGNPTAFLVDALSGTSFSITAGNDYTICPVITSGVNGSSGSSGINGASGSSGINGASGTNGTALIITVNSSATGEVASGLVIDGSTDNFPLNSDFNIGLENPLEIGKNYPNNAGQIKYGFPSADNFASGEIFYPSDGDDYEVTVGFGDLVVCQSNSFWTLADADDESLTKGLIGIAQGTEPSDGILLRGFVRVGAYSTLGTGQPLFISTTPGAMTATAPSAADDYVRIVGYGLKNLQTNTIYFNPESTWIKITTT